MYQHIKAYVEKHHMLQKKDHVIIGVSGGADSICLLFMLKELQKEYDLTLTAVHVHHGLRGESADADERYVADVCKDQGVELYVAHEDVNAYAKEQKLTVEEAGRNVRREVFEKVRKEKHAAKIALAHHQNDNAETLLWNLSRGCGLRGVCGISPAEGVYIRPLLCVQRQEIEAYLKENGIFYCTDETNLEDHYTRNRIRNHVIPYLEEEINAQTVEHMAETAEIMRSVRQFVEAEVEKSQKLCTESRKEHGYAEVLIREKEFLEVHETIRSFLIHEVLCEVAEHRKDIEKVHVQMVEELFDRQTGRQVILPYEMTAQRCYEGVRIFRGVSKDVKKEHKTQIRVFERTPETSAFPKKAYTKWFDYDIIENTVKIRHKQPGDYITIDKNGGTQSLKKYFTNAKVPREERKKIWLAADGSHILWIIGYRQNQAYQVTDKTRRILEIKFNGGEKDGRES